MHSLNRILLQNLSRIRCVSSAKELSTEVINQKQRWDILCAVSLERNPIITKEFTEIESRMDKMLKELEFENSHRSNFEKRMEDDAQRQKLLKSGKFDIEELDKVGQQTGHDFLDNCVAELKAFQLSPRVQPKEEKNSKSVKRSLDKHLLLVVKDKLGQSPIWILPQGKREENETLRQTAERILQEKCGPNINARFYGNAPSGFYRYKYPKAVVKDSVGAKIFFYKAQFLGGSVDIKKSSCMDYQWATRTELSLLPKDYCKSVKMFLIDEN